MSELSRWEETISEKHGEFLKKLSASRKDTGRRQSVCEVLGGFVLDKSNAGSVLTQQFKSVKSGLLSQTLHENERRWMGSLTFIALLDISI
eukprot:15365931-Ditylum_brightwellii.AAC.1